MRAPVRALDAGGWTDTWFAGQGIVCNVAMDDGVEVEVERQAGSGRVGTVEMSVPAFDDRYRFRLDDAPGRHPLLEAAVRRSAPGDSGLHVVVTSAVPPGAGLGTSASVVVSLIAALGTLASGSFDHGAVARAAHDVETDLGFQSGVQDQVAAAHGGCNLITIDPYPDTQVEALDLTAATWDALARRTITVYLNAPHRSSALHEAVIEHLTSRDSSNLLAPLRTAARRAADALLAGDLDAYGDAMIDNTNAQAELHPDLVSAHARDVIELAARAGAVGWKVNGAGGEGGTVTLVTADDPGQLVHTLAGTTGLTILPVRPARQGVRVVDVS